jgi:hypothetical protein
LNRIVYRTPLKKRFGHQHPVSFKDLQNLVSAYFLCDDIRMARVGSGTFFYFEFDEDPIRKRITMKEVDMIMEKFEFFHEITGEYLMGERTEMGFRIYSNFIIGHLEVIARGGTVTYNREVKADFNVNRKRYTFKDLQ